MTADDINIDLFIGFVKEREKIKLLKDSGAPAPWSEDPILNFYRFCNIRRRDDRVSKWLITEYYPKLSPDTDFWFVGAIARLLNWPPVLAALLKDGMIPVRAENFWPGAFAARLEQLKLELGKVYTSAYVVYPGPVKGLKKSNALSNLMLKPLADKAELIRGSFAHNSVETMVNNLATSFGINTFIAGQVAADLTYIPGQLNAAFDLHTYAPEGPGSRRGLNRLLGRPLTAKFKSSAEFSTYLAQVLETVTEWTPYKDLTLHDVQNCMCEFDKYCRVLLEEGRPRQNYIATTEF